MPTSLERRSPAFRLLLDISRMCQRRNRSTPTGIDKVEFAYLSYAMRKLDPNRVGYILTSPLGRGLINADRVTSIFDEISANWQQEARVYDPLLDKLMDELRRPVDLERSEANRFFAPPQPTQWGSVVPVPTRDLLRAGAKLRRKMDGWNGSAACYLHTSHSQLEKPRLFSWLETASAPAVFFLHDLIPIEYPEFCRPGEAHKHRSRMQSIAALARLILVNSDVTARSAEAFFTAEGLPAPTMVTVPLAVDEGYRQTNQLPAHDGHPYVVVLGTIEARKNLSFLLAVWRRIKERMGPKTPRLVIVGRRGWENENVLDVIERSTALAPFLVEAADLTDASVVHLMSGARMLLAPSLAEGFSLPVAEGLSLGIPVIASDIPVHREISKGEARLVDPLDGPGWIEAIVAMLDHPRPPTTFSAWGWDDHVEAALAAMEQHVHR